MKEDGVARVLLLGESAGSARYLTGALAHGAHHVRHVEARERLERLDEPADVVLISDYPSARLAAEAAAGLVRLVRDGGGLIMLGGWTTFTGRGGDYGQSPLAPLLPVICAPEDDRRNVPSGLWLEVAAPAHPIVRNLDFSTPPVICGYNAVALAAGASLLLRGRLLAFQGGPDGTRTPVAGASVPLLAVHTAGAGRVVAYMSDLVPHWCGGIVDWGAERLVLSTGAEVNSAYVAFLLNMVRWASGDDGD
jgi:uncharacterized membrane protein